MRQNKNSQNSLTQRTNVFEDYHRTLEGIADA